MAKNLSSAGQRRGYQSAVKYLDRWPFTDSLKRGYAPPTGLLPYADAAGGDATFTTSAGAATAGGGTGLWTAQTPRLIESTETLWTSATTAYNVTAPATLTEGDLLWVQFVNADTGGSFTTVPSGWTQHVPVLNATGGNMITAYWHIVTAGEEASPPATFDFVWSSSLAGNALLAVFRFVDDTTPIDVSYSSVTNGTATKTVPAITTVTDGAMVIGGAQLQSASSQTVNAPSGWQEIENSSTQNAGRGSVLALEGNQATAGSTGTAAFTQTLALQGYAYQVALRPAPVGGSGDATFTTTAAVALASGGSSSFTGAASFTTSAGSALASGGSATFRGDGRFTTSTAASTANGGSSAFTGTATFGTTAGAATAQGGSSAFTGTATFSTTSGAAVAQGGSTSFIGGAGGSGTFTTAAGAALASGGSSTFTGTATFATTAGAAVANGGGSTFTGSAAFSTTAGAAVANGGTGSFTASSPATFTTLAGAAVAQGGSSSFRGGAAFQTVAAAALASGGISTLTGGALFATAVAVATAAGGTSTFTGGAALDAEGGRATSGPARHGATSAPGRAPATTARLVAAGASSAATAAPRAGSGPTRPPATGG